MITKPICLFVVVASTVIPAYAQFAACGPGSGECCAANGTPGCHDQGTDCCAIVCVCDPFCCETAWDEDCASIGVHNTGCGAELLCAECLDTDADGVPDSLDVCCDTPEGLTVDDEGRPKGDIDDDCDVDLGDYALFVANLTGFKELEGLCPTSCVGVDCMGGVCVGGVCVPVDPGPVAISVNVVDPALCPGESTTLTAVATGGSGSNIFTFTTLPAGESLLAGESLTANADTATYTAPTTPPPNFARDVRVSVSEIGGSSDQVVVRISSDAPIADAGPDQTVCAGDEVRLFGGGGGIYAWTGPPGANFTPNENVQFPEVIPALAGVYTVEVADTNGCTDTDSATVTLQSPPTADAGPSQAICENDTATMAASATSASGILWSTSGDGSFDDGASLSATYTLGPGDHALGIVDLTLTASPIAPCTTATQDTMRVSLAFPSADAGADAVICSSDTVILDGMVENATASVWLGGSGLFIPDRDTLNAEYAPSAAEILAGNVTLTLVALAADACTDQDDLLITISNNPTATITHSGLCDVNGCTTCIGETNVSASIPSPGGPATIIWTVSGGNIVAGQGSTSILYNVTAAPGSSYTVSVGVDRDGCLSVGSIDVDVLADTCDDLNECTADSCSGGVCSNAPVANGTVCIDDGIECTSDVCTAGPCTHPPRAAGTACGNQGSQGLCDLGDTCNGAGSCLTNRVPNGTECRASAGDCDVAESCDGVSVNCPANGFVGAGTQCRASAGVCDVAEFCTGGSALCPANDFEPDTLECRPSAGDCDAAEFCTGFTAACPTDKVSPAGTPCGDQTSTECDNPNTCNATGQCLNRFVAPGTLCGNPIPQDICDDPDRCDGAGACSPQFKANTFECRPAGGNCDQPEFCPGNSAQCPADVLEPNTTVCRVGQDLVCDPDELCTGAAGAACPPDFVEGPGVSCDDGDGGTCDDECDGAGVCVGGVCP